MGDLIIWLVFEVVFGYLFYITGVVILRIVTFGKTKVEFHSFSGYKELKKSKVRTSLHAYLIGLLFYVVLIALLVLYYWQFT